jgi:heme/copper-type cytochrome/quinol oxidase subunit 3
VPRVHNAHLAVALLIAAQTTLFGALLVAYAILRSRHPTWPPADLPHLPIAVTLANSFILLLSAAAIWRAVRLVRRGQMEKLPHALTMTAYLGTTFVLVQGVEWLRLMQRGLSVASGAYGATFYTLIGMHALHVVGALVWVLCVRRWGRQARFSPDNHAALSACAAYWTFVTGLWPLLFVVVYLI